MVDWNEWSECDKKTGRRTDYVIKTDPLDGHDGEGLKCPPTEEDVDDCEGKWSDWTVRESPTGIILRSRKPGDGLLRCPRSTAEKVHDAETVPCIPEVCNG